MPAPVHVNEHFGLGETGARSAALPSPCEVDNRKGTLSVMTIAFKKMKLRPQWKEVKVQEGDI